jgi:antirestriction protein ArdC
METAPEMPKGELGEENRISACEATIAAMPNVPTIKTGGKAAYSPTHDCVEMPPFDTFKSGGEYYSTLFHELAHSTMHKSRLGRDGKDYAREELVAETCAAILCAAHGIEGRTLDNAKAYVAGWRKRCEDEPKLFGQVMNDAMKAAEFIMGRVKSYQKPSGEKLN